MASVDDQILEKRKKRSAAGVGRNITGGPGTELPSYESDVIQARREAEPFARDISLRTKARQAQLTQPFSAQPGGSIGQQYLRQAEDFQGAKDIQGIESDIAREFRQARTGEQSSIRAEQRGEARTIRGEDRGTERLIGSEQRGEERAIRGEGRGEEITANTEARARIRALQDEARNLLNKGITLPDYLLPFGPGGKYGTPTALDSQDAADAADGTGTGPGSGMPSVAEQQERNLFIVEQQKAAAAEGATYRPDATGFGGTFSVIDPNTGDPFEVRTINAVRDVQELGVEQYRQYQEMLNDPIVASNRTALDFASDPEVFGVNKLEFGGVLQKYSGYDTASLRTAVGAELSAMVSTLTMGLTGDALQTKQNELNMAIGRILLKLKGKAGGTQPGDTETTPGATTDEPDVVSDRYDPAGSGDPYGIIESQGDPDNTMGMLESMVASGQVKITSGTSFAEAYNRGSRGGSSLMYPEYLGNGEYRAVIDVAGGSRNAYTYFTFAV